MNTMCLNLTDSCNLACKYCFVHQHPHFMSLEVAKDAVHFLNKSKEKKEEKLHVTFFGGEPMLCFDSIIVPLVEWANEVYPNLIEFTITTNGTLLAAPQIEFLRRAGIQPLLSMDGDEFTQNTNRPYHDGSGSFERLKETIPMVLSAFPHTTMRATISQTTVSHLFDNYLFAEKIGFHSVFFCPNCREKWTKENLQELDRQVAMILTYRMLQYTDEKAPLSFSTLDNAFRNLVYGSKKPLYRTSANRCGLGTTSVSVGYDGSIYACQEQDSQGKESALYIGDIYNGIDEKKRASITKKFLSHKSSICEDASLCEDCLAKNYCAVMGCPSVSADLFGDFHIFPIADCMWRKAIYKYSRIMLEISSDRPPHTFINYLKRLGGENL